MSAKPRAKWKTYFRTRAPLSYVKHLLPKDVEGGFHFSIFGPDGRPREGIRRTRHVPPLNLNGRLTKFTFTKGGHNCFNFMPLVNGKTWPMILADADEPIIWAESEAKAAAVAALGHNVVTTGSIFGHHTKDDGASRLIDDLDVVARRGRKLYLLPDNDVHINRNVQDGVLDQAAVAAELGADVEILLLPEPEWDDGKREYIKLGADDYLHTQSDPAQALEKLPSLPLTDPRFAKWGKYRTPPVPSAISAASLQPINNDWLTIKPPILEYTWNALLPRFGVGLLVSEGGIGKTQLSIDLAIAVATGGKMLGLSTRNGRVLYIGLEDPPDVIRRRIYFAAKRRRAVAPDKRQFDTDIRKNLIVVSLVGSQFHLIEIERGAVRQAATLNEFIGLIKTSGAFELTILDPMSRLHGMDENANAIGTALINAAERIAQETPTTVLISHHTGKGNANSKSESAYSARGASGLADAARVVLRLREMSPKECEGITNAEPGESVLKLIHAKCNYAKRYDDIYLRRGTQGLLELFVPEFRNANSFDVWFAKLRHWFESQQEPFTRRQVTQDELASVSGETTSRDKAREFFDKAVAELRLVKANVSKKGGGTLYVINQKEIGNDA